MPLPSLPTSSFSSPQTNADHQEPRPPSPAAPPYSPITPTMSASLPVTNGASSSNSTTYNSNNDNRNPYPYAPPPLTSSLASSPDPLQHAHPSYPHQQPPSQNPHLQQSQQPHHASHPQPQQPSYPKSTHITSLPPLQPISESSNPDAIALRAAMSILQIQRQQALRDLKMLEQQKGVALSDPEGFMARVRDGRVRSREVRGVGGYRAEEEGDSDGDDDDDDDDDDEGENGDRDGEGRDMGMEIPGSQNVVRMPPVNWAQYHIVGESLDKLHEEQRRRPLGGDVIGEEDLRPREGGRERGEEHVIARPYDPFVDKLGSGGGRRKETPRKRG